MFDVDYDASLFPCSKADADKSAREKAWKYFQQNGFPSRHNERWKYTDLNRWLKPHLKSVLPVPSVSSDFDFDKIRAFKNSDNVTLVFVDGFFHPELSDLECDSGVSISVLLGFKDHPEASDYKQHPMLSFNDACFTSGVTLSVDKNVQLEKRIEFLYVSSGRSEGHPICVKHQIDLENGAELRLMDRHVSLITDAVDYESIVYSVNLAQNANVNWLAIPSECQSSKILTCLFYVQQAQSSIFEFFDVISTGILNRYDFDVHLNEEYATARVDGVFLTRDKMHADHQITITHHASNTESDVCFKGVASDKSTGIFNAKAIVAKGIEGIKALQSNKNLLLSKTATINTKPELEIYSDDVVCSHGATVGQLDEAALFYLQSRGISKLDALQILTEGFVKEVLERQKLSEKESNTLSGLLGNQLD